ncbi:hypothetical protein PSCFBP2116_02143 [Pseudomonas syringae]|uniref:Uncharacterized protein n=3 Tax=Pseudomonas syringae TaxID=317 RepID=A0A2K4WX34_PSESX|nr:hypothetical protein ALQ45_101307 [Pseudomonas amygdali pv. morsprunorum]RMU34140.1 hypothetical protein ALP31_01956 [Pseudomonas amygdali pv. morsprunorum]SOS40443.1 hypothetical protein CFBP3840_03401 [Pseudomonas syringae]SPD81660.1 hypothetical protein PSCFBP2116_02143 [Pseudomonas syringae]
MTRGRGAAANRNQKPVIKPWHEEYALSDTSPCGMVYIVCGSPSTVPAGCPKEPTWPYDKSMARHCIWPRNYNLSVIVDWEGEDLGGFIKWDMVLETVPAWTVRGILLEYAERERQIRLLEQHLQELEAA